MGLLLLESIDHTANADRQSCEGTVVGLAATRAFPAEKAMLSLDPAMMLGLESEAVN